MGTLSRDERITLAVFVGVGLLWITTRWHRLDVTFIALLGLGVLLTTGTMAWSTATSRTRRLDVFVVRGPPRMGELLNATRHHEMVRGVRRGGLCRHPVALRAAGDLDHLLLHALFRQHHGTRSRCFPPLSCCSWVRAPRSWPSIVCSAWPIYLRG